MSVDASLSPADSAIAPRDDSRRALLIFVADALAVAEATDPMLAKLLEGILGQSPSAEFAAGWRGDRRDGLELCKRLLTYVRQDVPDSRLDVSLGYIAVELASLSAASSEARVSH